jgi:CHRD domain
MATTLRTRTVLLTAAALVPAALTTTSFAGTANATSTAMAAVTLEATLRPSGDANGAGDATVRLNKARKRVCATLDWRRIQTPDAAHIHNRSDGSIKIDLTNAADGSGCTSGVKKSEIADVIEHPRRYYVNVHNPKYPAGAIQGDLHR